MLREAAARLNVGFDALQRDLRQTLRQKFRPAPASSAAAAAGTEKRPDRPVDEVELAALLGTRVDPELAGLVRRWLPYPLITDAVCRAVIHALAEEEADLMAALDAENDECKAFAAQIVNAPQKVLGREQDLGVAKAAQDLILSIWRRNLQGRRDELERRKQTLAGEERLQAFQESVQMLLDLKKLEASWTQALPILELHLQRFLES